MIGIIGVGGVARYAHLPSYIKNGLECIALCDNDANVCEEVASQFGISAWTTDLDAFLSNENLKIVDLAIPPIDRAQMLARIGEAGCSTLIQKPLCLDREELASILDVFPRDSHWKLNLTGRYVSAWRKVKALLTEEKIGTPLQCTIVNRDWWDREPNRWDLDVKNYIVHEMTIHHLDLCMYWFGMPKKVTGRAGAHPAQLMNQRNWENVLIEYQDGMVVQILDDWTLPEFSYSSGHPFEQIIITGSNGVIHASSNRVECAEIGKNSIEVWHKPRPGQQLPGENLELDWFPDSFGAAMKDFVATRNDTSAMKRDREHLEQLSALAFSVADSLDSDSWINI